MPKCSVCLSKHREKIDIAITSGASERSIAKRYGVSASAVHRHKADGHVSKSIKSAAIEKQTQIGINVAKAAREGDLRAIGYLLIAPAVKVLEILSKGDPEKTTDDRPKESGFLVGYLRWAAEVYEKTKKPEEFIQSRDKLPADLWSFLSPYTAEDYKAANVRLRMHESGTGGYGLKGDELISVFSLPGAHLGDSLVKDAVANGAKRLDCLGEDLVNLYKRNGFKVIKTDKWDERYAPDGWNYSRFGRPDLYYMER
ncbi:MAG TPA: hypothetical protein PLI05_02990 [Methanotrichaceae archaeon]|nr:hypothetical protein [Methanotrichaceae archaeon]HQI90635.1 hypothetical protein [Methanotrichaceae archaeon]HQJ28084.1 hypothetical protein [Methanotrichaceae archaeon]